MYRPTAFAEERTEELHRILRDNPLGAFVTHTDRGLDANQIPFELEATRGARGTLLGHIARPNPLWTEVFDGAEVMVIFRGPQGYISPNWYPSKQETHRHVPTGTTTSFTRMDGCASSTTRSSCAASWPTSPAGMKRPNPARGRWGRARRLSDENLRMIVGIEVETSRLEGKRKLGQNREAREDLQGAVRALQERGQPALATAMADAGKRK